MTFIVGLLFYFLMVILVDADPDKSYIRLLLVPMLFYGHKYKFHFDKALDKISNTKWSHCIIALFIVLAIARCAQFHRKINKPIKFMEDIAILNHDAGNTLWKEHKNPYSENLNPYFVGDKNYGGYKYPPLQIFYYMPFVINFDLYGIYWGNLIIYILFCLSFYYLLKPYGKTHAYLAILLFLSTDYHYVLSFNHGTNDHLPALFMLWSWYFESRNSNRLSPLLLSLSLLSKQLPGMLLSFDWLLKKNFKGLFFTVIFGLIGIMPFVLWDYRSFFENTIEFALYRPVRETSILIYLPSYLHGPIQLLGLGLIIYFLIKFRGKIEAIFYALLAFLITAKMSPAHYFVWVTAPMIIWFVTPKNRINGSPKP